MCCAALRATPLIECTHGVILTLQLILLHLHVVLRESLPHALLEHHVLLHARGEALALRVGESFAMKRVDALAVACAHDLVIPAALRQRFSIVSAHAVLQAFCR